MVVGARQTTGLAVFTVFGNAFSSAVQFLLLWLIQGAPDTLVDEDEVVAPKTVAVRKELGPDRCEMQQGVSRF